MNYVFFGATKFSEEILTSLIKEGFKPSSIFTIAQEFKISYSEEKVKNYNFSDLGQIAEQLGVPCYLIDSGESGMKTIDYFDIIKNINPDVILVMGWYYMVPTKIRNLALYGAWGIHASLLPNYAGGAPLVWAIINGESKTGATLFQLGDGVDDGDIIDQVEVEIEHEDTIKEVYSKITLVSKKMLSNAFHNPDKIRFKKQDKDRIRVFPQRKPDDGELDLTKPAMELYNFIRAQSAPYPGAFIRTCDGKKIIIEKARIE
jgi:methionyl-tRNA formyltransferase